MRTGPGARFCSTLVAGAWFFVLTGCAPGGALAQGTQPPRPSTPPAPIPEADVAGMVSRSVVQVISSSGTASGVKVAEGVLTTEHVVAAEDHVELVRSDGTREQATVAQSDPLYDLALLKTDLDVPRLETDPARVHRPGESVLAIGYPLSELLTGPPTVSRGVLSAVREREGVVLVQTDAAMDLGSSGSAIVDMRGKLLGVAAGGVGLSGGLNLGVASESIQGFLDGVSLAESDLAEPDDTLEQARPLELNAPPEPRSLHVPGDVDWVSVSLTSNDDVAVFAVSTNCDISLDLYDPSGTPVDENGTVLKLPSRLVFTAAESGVYYVRASPLRPEGLCRSYQVAAQRIPASED